MSALNAVNKCALAQQFSGAAPCYDVWATAQAEIAVNLMRQIPPGSAPALMVDLGCGTGLLSAQLLQRYPSASLVGIDLAPGMVEHCRLHLSTNPATNPGSNPATNPRARFVTGDVEDRRVLVPHSNLIASSCVVQWFADLPATLRMWTTSLAPGGLMAFACLLQGSFCELETAYYDALQCRFRGLPLPAPDTIPSLFRASGLNPVECTEGRVTAHYASSREALRSFQRIGAVFRGQPGHQALGPAALRRLLSFYDRHATGQGMAPVTHRVQYVIAERTS
jgi:malonyl-CoA O-methyltransferase